MIFLVKTGYVSRTKHGLHGNKVIKTMKAKNFLPENIGKNLAKLSREKVAQREHFGNLSGDG